MKSYTQNVSLFVRITNIPVYMQQTKILVLSQCYSIGLVDWDRNQICCPSPHLQNNYYRDNIFESEENNKQQGNIFLQNLKILEIGKQNLIANTF